MGDFGQFRFDRMMLHSRYPRRQERWIVSSFGHLNKDMRISLLVAIINLSRVATWNFSSYFNWGKMHNLTLQFIKIKWKLWSSRRALGSRSGLNFINVLSTAFTLVDPKSVKRHWWPNCIFYAFGIYERKSCT